ncbi:MAG TPA: FAD-dependent thymidylate synthase [Anaerolineaceae bacterium]|nr:FAD-dependent thymidylate synthase [Anaerolineaceae bacterium]
MSHTCQRRVYMLDPQKLPPETIAVTFAKTSRSPQTFREIAAELTDEKSAQFHEKWVVGYGHSSVAEHAVLHIAVENVSRLAVEVLQANRLASYTEKSTRYQQWDADSFYLPLEVRGNEYESLYWDTCRALFSTYQQMLPAVREVIARTFPQQSGESEPAWDRRIRSEYVDVCRYLLPAASLANLGITINARALEYALCKMLSHPLDEVRQMGEEIKAVAQAEVPTLVKYACTLPYYQRVKETFSRVWAHAPVQEMHADWCRLVACDTQGELRVLAAALFRFSGQDFEQCMEIVERMTLSEQQRLAMALLGDIERHTIPLRELEYLSYTFELTLDQGAYYELKRHRMMTQTPQSLTADLGYALPRAVSEAGMEDLYTKAMEQARQTTLRIATVNPDAAAYVVPNGFNRRVLLTLNLRSADHLVALRSAANAHFSIRRVAQRMAEILQECSPLFGALLHRNPDESWQEIESRYFVHTAVK